MVYESALICMFTCQGGHSISWEKQPFSLPELTKSKNKYLFIRDETDEVPPLLKDIHTHLTNLGERMIPIQEIAMAIVFCSCEKDCNPKFNRLHSVFQMYPDTESDVFSLAPNTPSEDGFYETGIIKKEVIIPESLDADGDLFATPKPPTPLSGTPRASTSKVAEKELPKIDNAAKKASEATKPVADKAKNPFSPPNNVPSTSKKGHAFENPPPKRARLDDSLTSTNQSTESLSKKRPADESLTSTSKRTAILIQDSLSESKKRKAEETLTSTRKKATKANPFAFLRRQEAGNPFASLRLKKEVDEDNADNEFLQILNQRPEKTAPVVADAPLEVKPLAYDYVPCDSSNIKWLSTSFKSEDGDESLVESEVEPEFKELFEKFKNTVVIEPIPAASFRVVPPRPTPISLDTSGDRKNFKKFRKVRCVRCARGCFDGFFVGAAAASANYHSGDFVSRVG